MCIYVSALLYMSTYSQFPIVDKIILKKLADESLKRTSFKFKKNYDLDFSNKNLKGVW